MRSILGVTFCLTLAVAARADVTIEVDMNSGQTIAGTHAFNVSATSDALITSVEFYVNDRLRATDSSTPYGFVLDTLDEPEGPIELRFSAYDATGASDTVTLELNVDNGLGQGLQHFLDLAGEALVDSRWDDALAYGRIAQKIDGDNAQVMMLMARANYGKGVYDLAQKYAEDSLAANAENTDALRLLSAIMLNSAFRGALLSSDKEATIELLSNAFTTAIESRKAAINRQIESLGEITDENVLGYVDLLTLAGRYSLAIDTLTPRFNNDLQDNEIANRLIYNQMRSGRFEDALRTMRDHDRLGELDGYGYALKAAISQYFGNRQDAAMAEREALLADPLSLGLRTSQAYMALVRRDASVLGDLAATLIRDAGHRTESHYYLSSAYYLGSQYDNAQEEFQRAMLAEPINYDMLIEKGNQSLSFSLRSELSTDEAEFHRNLAEVYFNAALIAKPESFEALTGLSLASTIAGDINEGLSLGRAAIAAGPEYAAAQYAYAAALGRARRHDQAGEAVEAAAELDAERLTGRSTPDPVVAWAYFWRYGRMPALTPPGL